LYDHERLPEGAFDSMYELQVDAIGRLVFMRLKGKIQSKRLMLYPTDTVGDLKKRTCLLLWGTTKQIQLSYRGRVLRGDATRMASFRLGECATIDYAEAGTPGWIDQEADN
jgi:hypothetical protein